MVIRVAGGASVPAWSLTRRHTGRPALGRNGRISTCQGAVLTCMAEPRIPVATAR